MFVGVDAHIDPAVCTIFTELFGEFVRAQRGDVGIAPYAGQESDLTSPTLVLPFFLRIVYNKLCMTKVG